MFDEEVFGGDSIQVNCHVTKGDKPLNISWLFNQNVINDDMNINTLKLGDKTSILSITSASERHAGNYTCLAENPAGRVTHTAILYVKGIKVLHHKYYL